jgi:hypothetical protein
MSTDERLSYGQLLANLVQARHSAESMREKWKKLGCRYAMTSRELKALRKFSEWQTQRIQELEAQLNEAEHGDATRHP